MTSNRLGRLGSRGFVIRKLVDDVREQQFSPSTKMSGETAETWDDEDFLPVSTDKETLVDPWLDDAPSQNLIFRESNNEPKTPEVPPSEDISVDESTSLSDSTLSPVNGEPLDSGYPPQSVISSVEEDQRYPEQESAWDAIGEAEEQTHATLTLEKEIEAPFVIWDENETDVVEFGALDPEFFDKDCALDDSILDIFFGIEYENFKDIKRSNEVENLELIPDEKIDISEYDEDVRQIPWAMDDTDSLRRARQKAASIVSKMFFTSKCKQDVFLHWLIDLFQHFDNSATYRAIATAVDRGVTGDTLRDMVALRDIWEDRTEWWVARYGWAHSVDTLRNGRTALTWKLARQICEARSDFSPEDMIDDAWLHEWLHLRAGEEGFFSFLHFIKLKIAAVDNTFQMALLWNDLRQQEMDEFSDSRNWVKCLPGIEESTFAGYQWLSPYN